MADSKGFALQLRRFIKKNVEEYTEKKYAKIVDDLGRSIIRQTPVLTGRARQNWYFTKGRPSRAYNPNAVGVSGNTSYARLRSAVSSITLRDAIVITNNAPYINKLEGGSSTQAPAGFLALNIARVRAKYKVL